MVTKQATLDRGGVSPPQTARIVLSACPDPTGHHAGVRTDLAGFDAEVNGIDRERNFGVADRVLDRGSPAIFSSAHPELDRIIYCYGESIDDVLRDAHRVAQSDRIDLIQIIIPSLTSLGFDLGHIADALETLAGLGCKITLVRAGERLDLDPDLNDLREVIRAYRLADRAGIKLQREAQKRDIRRWASIEKQGGRAGLGFEWVDGEIVPADDYDRVCALLEMVRDGEVSKNQAAETLGTSARTITRCIDDHAARYGLN